MSFGQSTGFGQQSAGFGQQSAGGGGGSFGQQGGGFGSKPAAAPGFGQQSSGGGSGFGQQGFGGSKPTFGFGQQNAGGAGGFGNKFGGSGGSFGQQSGGGAGFGSGSSGFGGKPGGFGSSSAGFGANPASGDSMGGQGASKFGSGGGFGSSSAGGGGGGGGGSGCRNCGEDGHMARECPNPRKPNNCFNCGEEGHQSRDCTAPRKPRGGCFNCGEDGHQSRECPQPRKERREGGGGGSGFGGDGYGGGAPQGFGGSSRFGSGGGATFGQSGFNSTAFSGGGGGGASFGGEGGQSNACRNCGEAGHFSRECPNPRKAGAGPGNCFNCGEEGHQSRECPKPREVDSSKPPASTFVPPEQKEEELFHEQHIEAGEMFDKFFDAKVEYTRHGNAPAEHKPIKSFADLDLGETILSNITNLGYKRLTPVQQHAAPLIIRDIDLMACAQTGSGKTAAFLLPIMSKLLKSGNLSDPGETIIAPRCIIMAPTRELAQQIYNEARKFAFGTVMRVGICYGGTSVAVQKANIGRGASILVGTLGRLKHFLEEGIITLEKLAYLVLDEADRMVEMQDGFYNDIKELLSHPSAPPKENRTTVMFSATFKDDVQTTARMVLKEDYYMVTIDKIGTANPCIKQVLINCDRSEKKDKCLELLGVDVNNYSVNKQSDVYKKKTIVFVSRKVFADTLGGILCQAEIPTVTIHGDRLQGQRHEALEDFRRGRTPVLVATAVAERGLDIVGVDHVINYDLPTDIENYVHRIGRTGRVGNPGRATSFYVPGENTNLAPDLVHVLEGAGQEIPDWLKEEAGGTYATGFTSSTKMPAVIDQDEDW